jgi:hypothetical protein
MFKKITEMKSSGWQTMSEEQSEAQKEYQAFFKKTLDTYKVKSPAELSDADKKKFFNEIDKGWSKEKNEEVATEANEASYKDAVAEFNKELLDHPMVLKAAKHYGKTTEQIVKTLQQRLSTKSNRKKDVVEVSIDFTDTDSGIKIKHKKAFDSVGEAKVDVKKHKFYIWVDNSLTKEKFHVASFNAQGDAFIAMSALQSKAPKHLTYTVTDKPISESEVSEAFDSKMYVKALAELSGLRPAAIEKFISDSKIDLEKMIDAELIKKGAKPTDFGGDLMTAISGKPNNEFAKKIIDKYSIQESSEATNEGKFQKDDLVYNTKTKTVGIVRIGDDEQGEVKTDADGNVNVDDLEMFNPIKNKHHQNVEVAPSTEKEINKRGLFNPFK